MKKRLFAVLLAMIIVIISFASGCTKKTTVSDDGGHVTLKWVLGGNGQPKDAEMVWAEFNKTLQKYLPNTTVEFEVIPYADYAEKWRLMAAAQEEVDLVWVGWMLDLYEEASKGSLLAMDDYLELVPDLAAELPEYLIDLGRVNGKLYSIPNYQIQTTLPYGTKTQKELAEQYLDIEAVTKTFDKNTAPTKEDYKIFDDYLAKLKADGKLQKGVSKSFLDYILGCIGRGPWMENIAGNACIDVRNDELKVYNRLTDFPENEAYFEIVNDWFKKGYIRKDILSVQDHKADEYKEDGYVLWSHSSFKGASETDSAKYGFEILSIPTHQHMYIPFMRPSSKTGIARTSENPERAMKLLELMNTEKGKELYNLLVFGLEGVHYEKTDKENIINWLGSSAPGVSSDDPYGFNNWAIGNIFNGYETQYDAEGWNDYIKNDVNVNAEPSPLIGFTLDTSPIKLELAQYDSIMKEYEYVTLGTNDNWKELIAERNEKLKKAGSDKIVEEVRRQIEEWKKVK